MKDYREPKNLNEDSLKKYNKGKLIAVSIVPFMTAKHDMSKEECIDMVAVTVNTAFSNHNAILEALIHFHGNGKVIFNGMTYVKGENENSFIQAMAVASLKALE